jgi:hypothetical protein
MVKTKFIDTCDGGKEYEMDHCPLLQFKMLIHGLWGSRRVIDVILNVNHEEPRQTIFLGLVNIHA